MIISKLVDKAMFCVHGLSVWKKVMLILKHNMPVSIISKQANFTNIFGATADQLLRLLHSIAIALKRKCAKICFSAQKMCNLKYAVQFSEEMLVTQNCSFCAINFILAPHCKNYLVTLGGSKGRGYNIQLLNSEIRPSNKNQSACTVFKKLHFICYLQMGPISQKVRKACQ